MSIVLFEKPGICRISLDAAQKVVIAKWHKLAGHDHLKAALEPQMRAVRSGQAKYVVVDVSTAQGVPSQSDQEWFVNTVFPAFKQGGLTALINVQPASALARLGASRWKKGADTFGFGTYEVGSLDDAYACINQAAAA